MPPDWARDHRNELDDPNDAEGKTVAFVHDGYESLTVGFEDETFIKTYK